MATIKDVARLAGVSVATVSRVINGSSQTRPDTVARVKQTMQTLGYRPNAAARTLVTRVNRAIGVMVGDVSDPFFGTLIKHVDTIALEHNRHLLIGNGYHHAEREKQTIESLIQNQVGPLIVHSKALDDSTLRRYASEHPAMVFINRLIPGLESRCIYLDNVRGAYLATEHLIQQGHRHIGYLGSNHKIEDNQQRYQGYLSALNDYRLCPQNAAIYTVNVSPDDKGGEQGMMKLKAQMPHLTALFCYNDVMAAGAVSVLSASGLAVPHALSIVGFDDSLIARCMHPKLTTVKYPIEDMAAHAARLAISLSLHGDSLQPLVEPLPQQRHYQPSLIIRESVLPAADST